MLNIQNLQISIAQRDLIKNLSFEIKKPSFIAIIGHNGSGKTSLLKSITNLLPYKGEIFLSSTTAFLNQKNNILFDIPASELAVMGKFKNKKFLENYSKEDFKEVERIFEILGISNLYNASVLSLSGGEQQLVWLAQILVQDKEIMLLDEPTQYLDIKNKKNVFTLLSQLVSEKDKVILCVTHDILNLYTIEGFVLNLSKENPTLEKITKEVLDENLTFLSQISQWKL